MSVCACVGKPYPISCTQKHIHTHTHKSSAKAMKLTDWSQMKWFQQRGIVGKERKLISGFNETAAETGPTGKHRNEKKKETERKL